jgi:catechol 2,3-dioxygenase-like lactoylglutathione lyase family enzyme
VSKPIQSVPSFSDQAAKEAIMSAQATQQRTSDASQRKIVPDRLAHIVFKTTDKSRLMDWYASVLNAHVVFQNDFIGFLTYDDEHHRIACIQIPGLQPVNGKSAGLHHVAFTYATLGDLLSTYERLRDSGVSPSHCVNHGPTTSMYYTDPDGNSVELQIDNFASNEEADTWFRSGEFAENPIGVDFKPDDLAAKFRSGVPEAELKKRPKIGPRGLPNRK